MKTAFPKNEKKELQNSIKTPYFLHIVGVQIIVHQIFPPQLWAESTFTHGCWASPCDLVYPKTLLVEMTLACATWQGS